MKHIALAATLLTLSFTGLVAAETPSIQGDPIAAETDVDHMEPVRVADAFDAADQGTMEDWSGVAR